MQQLMNLLKAKGKKKAKAKATARTQATDFASIVAKHAISFPIAQNQRRKIITKAMATDQAKRLATEWVPLQTCGRQPDSKRPQQESKSNIKGHWL